MFHARSPLQPLTLTPLQLFYDKRYSGTPMHNPEFGALATAMGARGLRVDQLDALPATMRDFLFNEPDVPALLNVVCEVDEHVLPMVPAGYALDKCLHWQGRQAAAAAAGKV